MKELDTLAANAANISLRREIWIHTKKQYMKESITVVDNATNISLTREIWINTKRQYMKESVTPLWTMCQTFFSEGTSGNTPKRST